MTADLDARLRRIRDKLAQVCALAPETFGGETHKYLVAPPLPESEVAAFEATHGVRLPDDFRAFVTQVMGSGAGPYFGILPPADWEDLCPDQPGSIGLPCLFTPDDDRSYEAIAAEAAEPWQGTIALVEQGCAYYAGLVVAGAARGRVIYINTDGALPGFIESPDFLSWYERWLDERLWGHHHFWFGTGMPGDEATLADAARTPTSPRRRDALHAMHRLPRLAPATIAIIADRLRDPDPEVQTAAIQLVTKFQLAAVESVLREALHGTHAPARLAALLALIAVTPDGGWHADARRLLADPDLPLAARALRELANVHALTSAELVLLLASPREVAVIAISALTSTPSVLAIDPLLAIAPPPYHALVEHVRAGLTTRAQTDAAYAHLADWAAREPCRATFELLCAFLPTHPQVLATLIAATTSTDDFVRYDAAFVLGEQAPVHDAAVIAALTALTTDETMPAKASMSTAWSVGANAAKALAKLRARPTS